MRRKTRNNSGGEANRLLGPLLTDKKKTVLAASLIAVMAFMWIRVLRKDAPQSAAASSITQQGGSETQSNAPSRVSFVELPKATGRHDVITRDFFTAGNWWRSIKGVGGENLSGTEQVTFVSAQGDQEVISLLAARLNLGAIVRDKDLQAFINGKMYSVGDKLLIREGVRTFECEVIQIKNNEVDIRCGQAQVTLKLRQVIED